MADFLYNSGSMNLWDGTIDLLTETLDKLMLVDNTTYTADRDDDLVDGGGASDPIDAEVSGTGYTGGYGGSGRKARRAAGAVSGTPAQRTSASSPSGVPRK